MNEVSNLLEILISDWQKERPDVDTSGKGIIYAIYLLEREFRRLAEKQLTPLGLRFGDYTALARLRRQGEPYALQPGALAEALDMTTGAISQILHKLEGQKLVTRSRNPNDNRQITVKLTKKGKAVVDEAFVMLTSQENGVLDELSKVQRKQLQDSLWNLIKKFRIS